MDENLIKTGDFAKMCAVSKKALYLYEAKGLLLPALVKDNGYRYYRLEQVDQVATIRLLEKLGSSLDEVGRFFALTKLQDRRSYLLKQQDAVEDALNQLSRIKSSLLFFDKRIDDFEKLGCQNLTIESCPTEYLEVSPFRRGVSLNPINFGPRYGVMTDDFAQATISRFFKVVSAGEGNFVKAAGKYAYFYQELDNEQVAANGPRALEFMQKQARVLPPFYQEDFSSSVLGHGGSVIIKYSAKLDL
ncbi:MerR family transcriptional regulator [Lactobacillus sp.]|uniref:MerR family transcriptional regulator n=1 Tax=Lactobacillus sp. TaxID=1591 RepID=UPI003F078631